ncbi:MAG: hypothetical protein ACLSAF_11015 [Intestinimonas sp.]
MIRALGAGPKVALVVGDRPLLRSHRAQCRGTVLPSHPAAGLKGCGIDPGPALFVKYCRVGASSHVRG